ncbi:MAG: hypothetical protein A3F72_04360 [Bacteroidetes bacterium RIFCSPLOWO2_12_FULL_35_15]|nr:MAG: hypothetical protein A3F72_04360 [Bacteroidetes bacterium RIFCSPLOWO2_12_FULL_35_15]
MLLLQSQGLLKFHTGKAEMTALSIIEHLGYVQIDTLAVVARAHHHTLWTRFSEYNEQILTELLEKDKSIFEYWSHAASYLPMSDYRFSLPRKKDYADGKSHWFGQDKKMNTYVIDRIKAEGELQSKDFEFKRSANANWYEWKPAKRALEQLFMEGKLMVAKRKGFQKVYDLTERVLPNTVDISFPTQKEIAEHLIMKNIRAYGLVQEKEITYLQPGLKDSVSKCLRQLLKEGELLEVKIEDLQNELFYTSKKQLKTLNKIEYPDSLHLLSPFDNSVIQRKRLQTIFGFDYQIECYVPEAKRKFGYFTLPVLYNDKFVARLDPKADRASKTFYVKSIHFEKGFKLDGKFNRLFAEKLKQFAEFNGCNTIVIDKAEKNWKKEIKKLL